MEKQSVIHNTFVIERNYPHAPERVFAAFADPAKKRRWFVDSRSHDVDNYEMDFRVQGKEHFCFRFKPGVPVAGLTCNTDSTFEDIVPNRRIVFVSSMTIADKLVSVALGTLEFLPTDKGTDLIFTHQGTFFEGSGGPEMRQQGWKTLFDKLLAEGLQ